ncbi:hypothetical protein SARI_02175 [Salmonella enterica subsp. arizonae serovar 62:z4,z23:-]|uniref:Uncharacterized protein n=1 Tax=Salmonella arizonae (strain ATCC BAA-731 / CDC346-86 / RSK2980) TaxID=41514 RepID=A9MJI9_SALAR|nr:hypothetical protein SARI_02175 [Salmonella enterica subsp. arizonae serovar 62:z4,z23:-]
MNYSTESLRYIFIYISSSVMVDESHLPAIKKPALQAGLTRYED